MSAHQMNTKLWFVIVAMTLALVINIFVIHSGWARERELRAMLNECTKLLEKKP